DYYCISYVGNKVFF
nr:immunoglobulin light chain junction region [Macaca mulatta]